MSNVWKSIEDCLCQTVLFPHCAFSPFYIQGMYTHRTIYYKAAQAIITIASLSAMLEQARQTVSYRHDTTNGIRALFFLTAAPTIAARSSVSCAALEGAMQIFTDC